MPKELPSPTLFPLSSERLHEVSGPISPETHALHDADDPQRRRLVAKDHAYRTDGKKTPEDQSDRTCAYFVGQIPRQRIDDQCGNGPRQKNHARLKRRAAPQALDIKRDKQRDAHERCAKQSLGNEAGRVRSRLENAHVNQRLLQSALALNEPNERCSSHEDRTPDERIRQREGRGLGASDQNAAEPDGRKHEREKVQPRRIRGVIVTLDEEKAEREESERKSHKKHEKAAPSQRINHRPAYRGADIGSEAHRYTRYSHSGSLTPIGKTRHGDSLQQRQKHACCNSLHDTTDK